MLRNPIIVCLALAAIVVVAAVAEAVVVLTTPPPANRLVIAKTGAGPRVYSPVFADAVKVVFGNLARTCTTHGERAQRVTWNLHGGTKQRR